MQKTKKELKQEYRTTKISAGIFQIRNLVNGKIFIGTAQNIQGIMNSNRFQLQMGSHPNKRLQAEWKSFGAESFSFESLDELATTDNPDKEMRAELAELELLWLDKLKPFEERGYNEEPKRPMTA